jgi:hypothetical protein
VFVSLDAAVAERVQANGAGRFQTTLEGFAEGEHTVTAVSQDRAGNLSAPSAPRVFTYREPLGARVPERFLRGDFIQVNLTRPARSVLVKIYTLRGRLVRTFESSSGASLHEFAWDLTDDDGHALGSGPYVVRVVAEQDDGVRLETRRATVVTR